jgi:hypothetical protein
MIFSHPIVWLNINVTVTESSGGMPTEEELKSLVADIRSGRGGVATTTAPVDAGAVNTNSIYQVYDLIDYCSYASSVFGCGHPTGNPSSK